jgi:CPA2 family monovalent cation:H+ antiporter-2
MIIVSAVVDPILISLVLLAVSIIVVGLVLRKLKQPYIIAYILAGLLLGSDGLAIVTDQSLITSLGSFG